jgi:hypothetical protein
MMTERSILVSTLPAVGLVCVNESMQRAEQILAARALRQGSDYSTLVTRDAPHTVSAPPTPSLPTPAANHRPQEAPALINPSTSNFHSTEQQQRRHSHSPGRISPHWTPTTPHSSTDHRTPPACQQASQASSSENRAGT